MELESFVINHLFKEMSVEFLSRARFDLIEKFEKTRLLLEAFKKNEELGREYFNSMELSHSELQDIFREILSYKFISQGLDELVDLITQRGVTFSDLNVSDLSLESFEYLFKKGWDINELFDNYCDDWYVFTPLQWFLENGISINKICHRITS